MGAKLSAADRKGSAAGQTTSDDRIIFGPADVDLTRSPLRASIGEDTYVLGAFNPGLTRLPNNNLLMMVRIAEAHTIYGIHHVRLSPVQDEVTVEYDATRLRPTEVRAALAAGGIPVSPA